MGLLDHYGDENKVITRAKAVTYSVQIEHGHWEHSEAPGAVTVYAHDFRYVRRCTYQYSYVGMDFATANECKEAFDEHFKRDTSVSEWDPDLGDFEEKDGGARQMAEVKVVCTGGTMYACTIDVCEEDTKMRIEGDESPAALFAEENRRQYDFN